MAFARDVYTATGGQTDFTISFNYLDKSHIVVTQNGTTLTTTTHYTFPNATTVRLVSGATVGDTIVLLRSTSQTTRLTNYTAGVLVEADLDNDSIQGFYMAQEAIDQTALTLGKASDEVWDATNTRIKNVGTPTTDADAATKSYVDGAALGTLGTPLGISNGGTGGTTAAAARTSLGIENGGTLKHKLDATSAPTAGDDSADGYAVGSFWIDVSANQAYLCVDASASAAIWEIYLDLSTESLYTSQQRMTLQTDTSSSNAVTFDFAGGDCFLDLTENITSITISNLPENAWATLIIQQGSGARTVTGWPAAVKWPADTAPTISTTDNAYDVISLYKKGSDIIAAITQDHR